MTPSDLQGLRATVVGGGRSGLAVSRLLAGAGADVFLTEHGAGTDAQRDALDAAGIPYEFGGHTRRALEADLFAISPGVPTTAPLVEQAMRQGIPIYSEIEVAAWFCRAPVVAITGSNGKTTTTSLLGHLFRTAGRETIVGGNIGFPFSDYVREAQTADVVVLEVSSFQLDHIDRFRPRVSILLNITPDHLDRYGGSFDRYAQAKLRIFENQAGDDVLVYNADDPRVRAGAESAAARGLRVLAVSLEHAPPEDAPFEGAFVRDEQIVFRIDGSEIMLMHAHQLALRGRHNLYNALAAGLAAHAMGVAPGALVDGLASFQGVPHRLELVRRLDDVAFVNDSKATNVDAVWYALESFREEPILLIAGGKDKGNDYAPLVPLVEERVRVVIAIGESADKVERELGPHADLCLRASSMEDAIRQAHAHAHAGDVVLLSPACASFDMFENYEDRGDTFRRLVEAL